MAKLNSSLKNMLLSLTVICLGAAALLAIVNGSTQDRIADDELKSLQSGIQEVTPPFNNSPFEEAIVVHVGGDDLTVYPAKMDGELVGIAVESVSHNGFSGDVVVLVGINPKDMTVVNYKVLAHSETPGLGDQMEEWFRSEGGAKSVIGASVAMPLQVSKDGGTVDAITASTISSRAFLETINKAAVAVQQVESEGLVK